MSTDESQQPVGFELDIGGGMLLKIPDTKFPLWNGPYHDGQLTIYKAESTGMVAVEDAIAFVGIYVDPKCSEDFLTFTWYKCDTPISSVISDITEKMFDQYCSVKAALVIKTVSDSSKSVPPTLH